MESIYKEKLQCQYFQFPPSRAEMLMVSQIAKRFRRLHGMDSIYSRCSTSQVQLANESRAVAIMGLNTHIIFYKMALSFWFDASPGKVISDISGTFCSNWIRRILNFNNIIITFHSYHLLK